jgi:Tfp pilus assembly protein PilE
MQRRIKKHYISLIRIIRGSSAFTLIELVFSILIVMVLILIAYPIYTSYIDKAKLTIATSALDSVQKTLESYHLDNNKYPESFDFNSCIDDQGHKILPSVSCDQLNKDVILDSYNIVPISGYVFKARAKDRKNTLITLTPNSITK